MAEILPDILSAFDARKRAIVTQLAELLGGQTGVGKLTQMLAATAEDVKKMPAALDVAGSVMPGVAAQGRQELADEGLKIGGMFIGPNAKLHPGQARALQEANRMAKETGEYGYPGGTIHDKTGWFKGPDGKWRMEISDQSADIMPAYKAMRPEDPRMLPEAFQHDDLYNLYPQLRGAIHQKSEPVMGGGNLGSFHPDIGEGHLGIQTMDMMHPEEARKTFLHELQHGVQHLEGFEPGGSSSSPAAVQYALDRMKQAMQTGESMTDKDFSYEGYRRLAGEAEARATEARANLGNAARKAILPQDSYDVPMNELILQNTPRGSEPSFSAQDPVAGAKSQLLPYQHQVFDRLYAMTKDIAESLARTKELTQIMTPQVPKGPIE